MSPCARPVRMLYVPVRKDNSADKSPAKVVIPPPASQQPITHRLTQVLKTSSANTIITTLELQISTSVPNAGKGYQAIVQVLSNVHKHEQMLSQVF